MFHQESWNFHQKTILSDVGAFNLSATEAQILQGPILPTWFNSNPNMNK